MFRSYYFLLSGVEIFVSGVEIFRFCSYPTTGTKKTAQKNKENAGLEIFTKQ